MQIVVFDATVQAAAAPEPAATRVDATMMETAVFQPEPVPRSEPVRQGGWPLGMEPISDQARVDAATAMEEVE